MWQQKTIASVAAGGLIAGVLGFSAMKTAHALPPGAVANPQFTLFMYETPAEFAARTDATPRGAAYWQSWGNYRAAMEQAGVLRGGMPLQLGEQALQVRAKDGKAVTTAGPFLAGDRHISGYFMIEVPSIEAAIEWAAKAPNAGESVIEVRPGFPIAMPAK